MLHIVVCIKQVPMASELPWDPKTGTLRREASEATINPACRSALEVALQLKAGHLEAARITAITMGPPMAEEVLREALALGADRGLLLTDRRLAGADTLMTSEVLCRAIRLFCPDFDLVLCGAQTTDSETAQVGPQIAEGLNVAGVSYARRIALEGRQVVVQREVDEFHEELEMDLPALVTVTTDALSSRYVTLTGLEAAFEQGRVERLDGETLGFSPGENARKGSATVILNVFSPAQGKDSVVLTGAPKRIVDTLLDRFGDRIGAAIGKDIPCLEEDR